MSSLADTTARQLPPLPPEVGQLIAQHLDRRTAFALTQSCKGLRDIGETALYRTVDITSGYDSHFEAEPTIPKPIPCPGPEHDRRQVIVAARCSAYLRAIVSYPYRASCVTYLRLEPSDGTLEFRERLVTVLRSTSSTVRLLDLASLPYNHLNGIAAFTCDERHQDGRFYDKLSRLTADSSLPLSLPALRSLRIDFNVSAIPFIPQALTVLLSGGGIRDLSLRLRLNGGLEKGALINSAEMPGVSVQHLTNLTIDGPFPTSFNLALFYSLLARSPRLRRLSITDHMSADFDDDICRSLQTAPHIKECIVLAADDFLDPEANLAHDEKRWEHVEKLAYRYDYAEEVRDLDFFMHPVPSLTNLTILTPVRPDRQYAAAAGISDDTVARYTPLMASDSINTRAFDDLTQQHPRLHTVMYLYDPLGYPCTYRPYTELEYFVPSDRWEAEGRSGFAIRDYYRSGALSTQEAHFYHIRALTRVIQLEGQVPILGYQRYWLDQARYGEQWVPLDVLQQVYKAAGMNGKWKVGGRDMELGQGGWIVLDGWLKSMEAETGE